MLSHFYLCVGGESIGRTELILRKAGVMKLPKKGRMKLFHLNCIWPSSAFLVSSEYKRGQMQFVRIASLSKKVDK